MKHLLIPLVLATLGRLASANDLAYTEAEVRRVNPAGQEITLKHGEIKNLDMPPMTMVFKVADPQLLAPLKAGDRVRFTAEQRNGTYTVLKLEKKP